MSESQPIVTYCEQILASWLARKPVPDADPWASLLFERFTAELKDHDFAQPVPDVASDHWLTMFSLWTRTGRVKRVWPALKGQRKAASALQALADSTLSAEDLAASLGLETHQCPSCKSLDRVNHYIGQNGRPMWKCHTGARCGASGGAYRFVALALNGKQADILAFLSEHVQDASPPPAVWLPEDMRALPDDPEADTDDTEEESEAVRSAWYTPDIVARIYEGCLPLTDTLAAPVAEYVTSRQLPLSIDARAAFPSMRFRGELNTFLETSPALVTPIRAVDGTIYNLQLRFCTTVERHNARTHRPEAVKTSFFNGGNPGATYGTDNLPYTYGNPHELSGAPVALFCEGGPDTHTLQALARKRVAVIGALSAGQMRDSARLVYACRKPPKKLLVLPHFDPLREWGDSAYRLGVKAGDDLAYALRTGDTPPVGCVLAGTGHRPDKLGGWDSFDTHTYPSLVQLAFDALSRIQPERVISGMAAGWDHALAEAAHMLGIPFTAAIPCDDHASAWPEDSATFQRWHWLKSVAADVTIVSPGPYRDGVMGARNVWMSRRATHTLALWNGDATGGTASYLRDNKTPVCNLWYAWTDAVKVWDWPTELHRHGLNLDSCDFNDLLKLIGPEALRAAILRYLT